MSLKDILVIVDNGKACAARLELAVRLAEEHEARLIGLFVRSQPHVPQFIMSQLGPEVADVQKRWAGEAAVEAKALFDKAINGSGLSSEWRDVQGLLLEQTVLHARYADLVIAGQYDSDSDLVDGQAEMVDHLVLECGRPVLVVPYAGDFTKSFGKHAVVAWNATREATRAANDALPLLQKAGRVDVVAVNPRNGNGRDGHGQTPSADISLHLARHGVKADAQHIEARDMDVGATLLNYVSDEGADLLVMGAYGRSRLRELVLGGATRHLLREMTVPVLMSH